MNFIHDDQPQIIYDAFNTFIFSMDRKLFGKLASKLYFTELTKHVPGDIVELGVFKGSGMAGWLKASEITGTRHKEVLGFDTFNFSELMDRISTQDKNVMRSLFEKRNFNPDHYEQQLSLVLQQAGFNNFGLIKGDVFDSVEQFLVAKPGFRASIVNFDLDTAEPTEHCLELFWSRVPKGGALVFDEYGIDEWTESNAVDLFCESRGLQLQATPYRCPSAYLIK